MQPLANFALKWCHPEYRPLPIQSLQLDEAESALGLSLPPAYRTAVLEVGLPRPTASLLHSIVETSADLHDVAEFLNPAEIVCSTQEWRELGLPSHLIAFASDCMGNLFGFDGLKATDQDGVWFYDHDSGETRSVAPSFEEWLKPYLDLTFVHFET